MNRRSFLNNSAIGLSGILFHQPMLPIHKRVDISARKFKVCLNPFSIGRRVGQHALLDMAIQYGFESIVGVVQELEKMDLAELNDYRSKMHEFNISWGSSFLPVEFRKSDQKYREDLSLLPVLAEVAANAGLTKMSTWIMPTHDELTYLENFQLHKSRLSEILKILEHFDITLGLEYVGPKTLKSRDRYSFIGSMKELKELIAEINQSNAGFQLDSFHWYCAGETEADLLTLDKRDIVTVDLNDANPAYSREHQIDSQRELPGHSGIIDLKSFVNALIQIGYDGPVRAEPFNDILNEMDDDTALKATAAAMYRTLAMGDY